MRAQLRRRFEQDRHTQGIVERAVVDDVAIDRGTDADVIQMRGIDQMLRRERRVAARQHRDHIPRLNRFDLGTPAERDRARQREAFKRALARSVEQRSRSQRAIGENQIRGGSAHGGGRAQFGEGRDAFAVDVAQTHAGLLPIRRTTRPRCIGLVLWRIDGNDADRAALGDDAQFFAAGAVERATIVVEARGRAGKHDRDLAFEIQAGEIVVIEIRRMHALADEHRGRVQGMLGGVVVQAR